MENNEKNKDEYAQDDFKKEFEALAVDPANEGDFPEPIDTAELNDEDMAFWLRVKDKSVTRADMKEYVENFEKNDAFKFKTRDYFRMFAVSRAQVIVGKREMNA